MDACRFRVINPADKLKIATLKELCERNGFLIDIVEESENVVAENLVNSHPAGESTSDGVPENSRWNLEAVYVSVAENPENSHPAGESTSGGGRNFEVKDSVSVSFKWDVFLKILTGMAEIASASAMIYAAWKIGNGVDSGIPHSIQDGETGDL